MSEHPHYRNVVVQWAALYPVRFSEFGKCKVLPLLQKRIQEPSFYHLGNVLLRLTLAISKDADDLTISPKELQKITLKAMEYVLSWVDRLPTSCLDGLGFSPPSKIEIVHFEKACGNGITETGTQIYRHKKLDMRGKNMKPFQSSLPPA